jgi:hypothetical protein
MKTYPIPGPLLQDIVNYLEGQPWRQVTHLLAAIREIAVATDQPQLPRVNGGDEASPN